MEFRRLTSRDAELGLAGELDKLARTGADKTCQQNFAVVFTIFGGGTSYSIIIEGATFFYTLDFKDLTSATGARRELLDKEFDGFKKLFGKFIDESGPSVVWDNIDKLPEDAVIACSRQFEGVTIKYYYFRYRRTPA